MCAASAGRARLRGRCGGAERRDRGDILGAGAAAALLSAAADQRIGEVNALVALDQRAGALRAADLVRAERQQVGAERRDVERDAARRLHGIDMQQAAVAMHDLGRLARPAGSRRSRCSPPSARRERAVRQRLSSRRCSAAEIDHAIAVDRKLLDLGRREPSARQHRRMLDRRDQQAVERPLVARDLRSSGDSASAFASVPPEVKMTLRASAPTSAATRSRACSIMLPRRTAFAVDRGRVPGQFQRRATSRARLGPQRRTRIPVQVGTRDH